MAVTVVLFVAFAAALSCLGIGRCGAARSAALSRMQGGTPGRPAGLSTQSARTAGRGCQKMFLGSRGFPGRPGPYAGVSSDRPTYRAAGPLRAEDEGAHW